MSGGKILINTGPSARGWHRLEAYLRCPQLYAWGYGQGGSNPERAERWPPTAPLVRGSIGHAGLAHLYTAQRCAQLGEDFASRYYAPSEAMARVADTFGDLGGGCLPTAARVVRAYAARYATERFKVIGVEVPAETTFEGYRYTARLDLVIEDRAGKVWIVDHKLVARIEGKVFRRYVLSGQFLGQAHLGARIYGARFGGVRLNLLGCNSPGFERATPEPAPHMLDRFPHVVRHAEEGIARLEALIQAGEPIPASPSEHTCWGSYGECPAFELCRWGSSLPIAAMLDAGEI